MWLFPETDTCGFNNIETFRHGTGAEYLYFEQLYQLMPYRAE